MYIQLYMQLYPRESAPPNGIWIGSCVFARLAVVTRDQQTQRQTAIRRDLCSNMPRFHAGGRAE